ncbi:MAG: DUF5615 family PIN-like protein [Chloroflexota bacterium]|nr:DUF5615 family PIN-like protein [Chloroflexota bacterium]
MNPKEVIKLYLNEDVHTRLAEALCQRGFDAITTVEAGMSGSSDEEQLAFATSQGRAILTFNRGDYARLHKRYTERGWEHCGIIVSEQYPIGELLRRMLNLLISLSVKDMRNRLEYLSQWGEAIS